MTRTRTQQSREIAVATPLREDVLLLRTFSGTEAISTLFEYELDLLSENHDIPYTDLVGEPLTVRLERGGDEPRYFSGIVSRFVQTGEGGAMSEYRATLVPWLWLLTRRSDCRIFQGKTVPDIIKQVFRDLGLTDFEDKLDGTYREREYCVQYRETDFTFVSRLMEEEGIYYFFRHEDGKHVLVLADSTTAVVPVPGYEEIRYKPFDAVLTDREFIHTWEIERQLQPGKYAHTDFDFTAPRKDLLAFAKATRAGAQNPYEMFDYPGRYETAADGEDMASVRLDEFQTRLEVARGTSDSRGIAAGSRFELADFRREDQNKGYLVTSTAIRARSDAFESAGSPDTGPTMSVRFTAIDAAQLYRAPRVTARPTVQGPQTAIVVGKQGEEIWTDAHGRVKVQFPWDRDSPGNENSSCWIRVSQPWAGKKWGAINIPRVGQEVIVEFLEGDPDRPIITGRVYNGESRTPYPLPSMGTVTTMKTSSSKGGGGFNEIRFEDKKGDEQIFIHAEKNHDTRVKQDAFEWIGRDTHLIVKNDQIEKIENDRHATVVRDHTEEIGRDRHVKVKGKEAIEIGSSHSEKVKDDVIEDYGKNQSTRVAHDLYIKADNICIEAGTNITIKVGSSFIAIESGGIKIGSSADVILEATGKLQGKGTGGLKLESPAAAELSGATTTVKGTGAVQVQAPAIKLSGAVKIG